MLSACVIRHARPEDISEITAIYAVHVQEGTGSFEVTPPDETEMARRWEAVMAAGLPYLVAELDGQVAGYAYVGPYRPRPAYRYTVENSVYVATWAHRRGIGKALLQAIISVCEAAGKRQMIAVIGDTENTASIALHQSVGFEYVGVLTHVGFKHGAGSIVSSYNGALGPELTASRSPAPLEARRSFYVGSVIPSRTSPRVAMVCCKTTRGSRRSATSAARSLR